MEALKPRELYDLYSSCHKRIALQVIARAHTSSEKGKSYFYLCSFHNFVDFVVVDVLIFA